MCKRFTVMLSDELNDLVEERLIKCGRYTTKNEAVRSGLRLLLDISEEEAV